jgi:hypothetical protein
VDAVVVREGTNFQGRYLAAMFGLVGQRILGRALDHTVRAIEPRNRKPRPGEVT